jgi:tetratricopeptide (TPR) repeat protein
MATPIRIGAWNARLWRKAMVSFTAGLVAAVSGPAFVFASGASGGQPGEFLSYGAGARALSMGGAFFGVADDASATYWNPAGLPQVERKELMAMQATLFADTTLSFISYVHPTATRGTLGINYTQLASGNFQRVSATFAPGCDDNVNCVTSIQNQGTFQDLQRAVGLSWGKQIGETVSIGFSFNHIERQLDTSSDRFDSVDIALMKTFGPYRVALGIQNAFSVKSGDTQDVLPIILRWGNAFSFLNDRLIFDFDLNKSMPANPEFHFGGEYWLLHWFALRFGILGAPQLQETDFGFGLRYRNFGVDVGEGLHTLGTTTRIAASFRFGDSQRDKSERQVRSMISTGFDAFKQGNFLLASQRLNAALDADPTNSTVRQMLGRIEIVIGSVQTATGSDEVSSFIRKGVAEYVDGRDLRAAVNSLRYAFNKDPKNEKLLRLLNTVEKEAGVTELSQQIEGAEVFTLVDQKIYEARQAIYDGKYDLAVRRAQDVLDLEPNNVTALEVMGSSFFLMDQREKAKAVWLKVMTLDPNNKVVPQFLQQLGPQ